MCGLCVCSTLSPRSGQEEQQVQTQEEGPTQNMNLGLSKFSEQSYKTEIPSHAT